MKQPVVLHGVSPEVSLGSWGSAPLLCFQRMGIVAVLTWGCALLSLSWRQKCAFIPPALTTQAPCSPLYLNLFIERWKKCEWLVNITGTCFKVPSSHWLQWCRTCALKILKSLPKCNYECTSLHYSVLHPCIHLEKLFKCCNPNHMAQSLKEGI